MTNQETLKLISFPTCPFVQRSVITANHKQIPVELTYIDLEAKPQWFLDISPLGKVPVLKVEEQTIFESAVINEFLDEYSGEPRLLPDDLVTKAKDRAWIEFAGTLNMLSYRLYAETTEEGFENVLEELSGKLHHLEQQLGEGPYWHGDWFSLVDATYAPFFMRVLLASTIKNHSLWESYPKCQRWADALLKVDSVQNSVRDDFKEELFTRFEKKGSYLLTHLEKEQPST